jgi:hypothetical protein
MVRSESQFQCACRVRSLSSHSDEWYIIGRTKPFASSGLCRPLQRSNTEVSFVVLGRYTNLPRNVKDTTNEKCPKPYEPYGTSARGRGKRHTQYPFVDLFKVPA